MFFINVDFSALDDLLDIGTAAEGAMKQAANDLTAATRAKIVELANEKLHTRRAQFIEGLSHFQVDETTWVVNLDAKARWIDEGMKEHSMLDDLLKSKKAKRSKDGSTYVVVPFQHNKAKQNLTPGQQMLLNTIKKELAKVGTTPNQIETNGRGEVKLGLVRSLDITKAPVSTPRRRIGAGPTGQVAQGPTGIPILKGVRVYQKEFKNKAGETKVGRFVMTFRTASSKMGPDRWRHPGLPPTNLLEEGVKWALEQWESKIAPQVLARLTAKLS